jgi:uncharacterized protein (TIGR03437 family)
MALLKSFVWTLSVLCLLAAGSAQAQTVSIVSGNGQLVLAVHVSEPMIVKVTDAAGNPLKNVTVTWAVAAGIGTLQQPLTSTTDNEGKTSKTFVAGNPPGSNSYVQSTITAAYQAAKATFTQTTVALPNNIPSVGISGVTPGQGTDFSGAAGQQAETTITVHVLAVTGDQSANPALRGVRNVGLTVTPLDPNNPATVACAGGTVMTDSTGTAVCHVVFGGKIGSGNFAATIGGLYPPGGFTTFFYAYHVTVGPPGIVKIVGGDHQSGNPGALLPAALEVQVTDLGGNVSTGVPMVFEAVVPGTVTFENLKNTTDSAGKASAQVRLGSNAAGPVQVRVRTASGNPFALFNLTANITFNSIQKISGEPQNPAIVNTPFPTPLVVQVNDVNNNPVTGALVTFALVSGDATFTNSSSTTNAQGQAATTVIAGSTPGPIEISATVGSLAPVTFSLTSRPKGPACDPDNTFWNGASFVKNAISPGAVATITCSGLAPGVQGSVFYNFFGPMPYQIAHLTVKFGDKFAPIYSVSNIEGKEQVNVQVPFEIEPGPVDVTLDVEGGSATVTAQVKAAAPGIFETIMADGSSRAIIIRPDGSLVTPENPAQKGERVTAYATGLIPAAGTIGTNMIVLPGTEVAVGTPVIVGVNNAGVHLVSATYANNLIGVWLVVFDIPDGTASGANVPFALATPVNGKLVFAQSSKIAVQ